MSHHNHSNVTIQKQPIAKKAPPQAVAKKPAAKIKATAGNTATRTKKAKTTSESPKARKKPRISTKDKYCVETEHAINEARKVSLNPSAQRALRAYTQIAKIWPDTRKRHLEDSLAVIRADEYYRSHIPTTKGGTRIELLVLSESHAFTSTESLAFQVKPEYRRANDPSGHLRLVHALGYGEPWILEGYEESGVKDGSQMGTPLFWQMLGALGGTVDATIDPEKDPLRLNVSKEEFESAFASVTRSTKDTMYKKKERLRCKRDLLDTMKLRKVVFGDICPVAIYLPSQIETFTNKKTGNPYFSNVNKLSSMQYNQVVRVAWREYSSTILHELKPKRLIILGKMIISAIGHDLIQAHCVAAGTKFLTPLDHPSYNMVRGFHYRGHLRILRAYARGDDVAAKACADELELFRRPEKNDVAAKAQADKMKLKDEAKEEQRVPEQILAGTVKPTSLISVFGRTAFDLI